MWPRIRNQALQLRYEFLLSYGKTMAEQNYFKISLAICKTLLENCINQSINQVPCSLVKAIMTLHASWSLLSFSACITRPTLRHPTSCLAVFPCSIFLGHSSRHLKMDTKEKEVNCSLFTHGMGSLSITVFPPLTRFLVLFFFSCSPST